MYSEEEKDRIYNKHTKLLVRDYTLKFNKSKNSKKEPEHILPSQRQPSSHKLLNTDCLITLIRTFNTNKSSAIQLTPNYPYKMHDGIVFQILFYLWQWNIPCQQSNIWITILGISHETHAISQSPTNGYSYAKDVDLNRQKHKNYAGIGPLKK